VTNEPIANVLTRPPAVKHASYVGEKRASAPGHQKRLAGLEIYTAGADAILDCAMVATSAAPTNLQLLA